MIGTDLVLLRPVGSLPDGTVYFSRGRVGTKIRDIRSKHLYEGWSDVKVIIGVERRTKATKTFYPRLTSWNGYFMVTPLQYPKSLIGGNVMTKIQRRSFDVHIDLDKITGHEGRFVAELLRDVAESMELSDHINNITNNLYGHEGQHVGTATCRTTEIIT